MLKPIICECGKGPAMFEVKGHSGYHCYKCLADAALLTVPGFVEVRTLEEWERFTTGYEDGEQN